MPLRGKIIYHLFALLWLLCPFPNHPATGETSSICTNRIYKTICLWLNVPFACLLKSFRLPLRIKARLVEYLYIVWNSFGIYITNTKTRKHSCSMRTARLLTISRSIPCILGRGDLPNKPPRYRLSRPLGCRPPGHVTCDACWEANPPPWTEWQMLVKILPCPNFVCGR